MSPFDKTVVIVTGKGGTGKTSTAAALGLRSARCGHRTLLVECNGAQQIGPLMGSAPGTYEPQQLADNLYGMTITSDEAIEDFVVKQIKVRALYSMVFRNRVMGPFMDAVPGLHDAVHLGKVYDLTEEDPGDGGPGWDRIIVDAPATGHGLHMLNAPRALMELTRRGPIHQNARLVHDLTSNVEKTGIVVTCLPEDMPVAETLHLNTQLSASGYKVTAVVLNEILRPDLPASADWPSIETTLHEHGHGHTADLVERYQARSDQQMHARTRLQSAIRAPLFELPLLLGSTMDAHALNQLSHHFADTPEPV